MTIALFDLLQLPQKIPNPHQPNDIKTKLMNQINPNTDINSKKTINFNRKIPNISTKSLTKTWTWREPRSWPRASSGKSSGAHQIQLAEPSQQLGIGETAPPNHNTISKSPNPKTLILNYASEKMKNPHLQSCVICSQSHQKNILKITRRGSQFRFFDFPKNQNANIM